MEEILISACAAIVGAEHSRNDLQVDPAARSYPPTFGTDGAKSKKTSDDAWKLGVELGRRKLSL
jgi:hypothetical protein